MMNQNTCNLGIYLRLLQLYIIYYFVYESILYSLFILLITLFEMFYQLSQTNFYLTNSNIHMYRHVSNNFDKKSIYQYVLYKHNDYNFL